MKKAVTLLTIILLLLSLTACDLHEDCGEYTQLDLDEAYDEGYSAGHDEGYEEGHDDAYYDFYEEYEGLDHYTWMMDNIVFTTRTGECYHKITCQYVEDTQVWVYFTNGAEDAGYRPCSYCLGGYYEP